MFPQSYCHNCLFIVAWLWVAKFQPAMAARWMEEGFYCGIWYSMVPFPVLMMDWCFHDNLAVCRSDYVDVKILRHIHHRYAESCVVRELWVWWTIFVALLWFQWQYLYYPRFGTGLVPWYEESDVTIQPPAEYGYARMILQYDLFY